MLQSKIKAGAVGIIFSLYIHQHRKEYVRMNIAAEHNTLFCSLYNITYPRTIQELEVQAYNNSCPESCQGVVSSLGNCWVFVRMCTAQEKIKWYVSALFVA